MRMTGQPLELATLHRPIAPNHPTTHKGNRDADG